MGTRCLTVMEEEDGTEIAVLYRQMDGYPDGHGAELREYVKGKRMVNGIGSGDNLTNAFNGAGDLAASIIAHFKTDIGGFYLHPAGTRDMGEEYIYFVRPVGSAVRVTEQEA